MKPSIFAAAVLLAVAAAAPSSAADAPLTEAIATLRAVGPLGEGNDAAQAAWRIVAAAPAEELPAILAAIDGANPLAANWLHAAVDAIGSRQAKLEAKSPPPVETLEAFVRATQHSPRARRLAFDWLVRFDATASDRLIPSFLDDPAVELRRDAVAQLILQGDAAEEAGNKQEARKLLRHAFAASRDLDQVKSLAERLKNHGETVDLAKHFGFITRWRLIGPFDNTAESAFDVAYPPETKRDFAAEYMGKSGAVRWIEHTTDDAYGMVDLNVALGKANGVVAYAAAKVHSLKEQEVEVRIGCICANKAWVNGQLVISNNVYHSGEKMDQYVGRAKLREGNNEIVVKILQNEQTEQWAQDWHFQLRICDSTGTPVGTPSL